MKKEKLIPRLNWQKKCEDLGFYYHSIDDKYWIEEYAYEFKQKEIDLIYKVTKELHLMCLDLVDNTIKKGNYDSFKLNQNFIPFIENSWNNKESHIYGRFDLCLKNEQLKMLEYNADTPTSIVEASIIQKNWHKEQKTNKQQFNQVEELLVKRWNDWKNNKPKDLILYFTCVDKVEEDWVSTEYLRKTADLAGISTAFIYINDIGWNEDLKYLVDINNQPINYLFKLYPWEWICEENIGNCILNHNTPLTIIEPAWKMLLSNKAILPILWEQHKNHPNLLASYFSENLIQKNTNQYVKKPLFSREGSNITMYDSGSIIAFDLGHYGKEGYIYQEMFKLPEFDGRYPVIGSWIIGDEPAGINIRDDASLITTNMSWAVPHYIK